jgi:hypothetical protein
MKSQASTDPQSRRAGDDGDRGMMKNPNIDRTMMPLAKERPSIPRP